MSYRPVYTGEIALRDELDRISAAFESLVSMKFTKLHVAPAKPVYGQVVVPDGTHWDPLGTGQSIPTWYNGTAWVPLTTPEDPEMALFLTE